MPGSAQHTQKLLLFTLAGQQTFAMGTLKIKEIIPPTALNRVMRSHPAVLGVTTVRGTTLPVIDLAAAVGYKPLTQNDMENGSIIITDCQRKNIGFLVRRIDRIIDANWREIAPPPSSLGRNAFVTGLVMLDEKAIQVLDLELLFAEIYPDPPEQRYAVLSDVERERLRPLNILMVDDSHIARKQLADALDHISIPYQVTTTGSKALEQMQRMADDGQPVDILVSDIEMPGLDGYELAFTVRDTPSLKGAYIILHTSLNSEMSVSYAHQVGADEALSKFDAPELLLAMLRGADALADQGR